MGKFACNLSIVPLRAEASHRSEMVSQLLFGETFEILEEGIDFVHIKTDKPSYQGWIQKYQYDKVDNVNDATHIVDVFGSKAESQAHIVHLQHGTYVSAEMLVGQEKYQIQGAIRIPTLDDFEIEFPKLVTYYKNTPYLWGGRSNQGIDCSGFSQVVYRHFSYDLPRDAYQQAEIGQTVDFLTEIKAGDLAFFDNEAGKITHVGIMIDNETIIHASGRVRIDKMDSEGIFNAEQNKYTHKLRIIKRYF